MLFFAHIGITLGAGLALKKLYANQPPDDGNEAAQPLVQGVSSHVRHIVKQMDLRVLMVGAMLPDIIDKPLGQYIFRDMFMNGRTFAHTLVFLIAISLLGAWLYRRRGNCWLVVLSFGSALHMLEDSMWNGALRTLLWPFRGWSFEKLDLDNWVGDLWNAFLHKPAVYVPEWTGIIVVAGLGVFLIRRKEVRHFIRTGLVV